MQDVIIMGGHTAVARSLTARLVDRGVDGVVAATTSEYVDDDLVLLDEAILGRGGLFVLAMQSDLVTRVADALRARGSPIIDLVDEFKDAPRIWPGLVSGAFPQAGLVRIAMGPAHPVAATLAGLAAFLPKSVRATTLESAVARGQPGIDELSDHTRAVFSMREAEPEQFPASLAFDPMPSLATGEAHPHEADAALVDEVTSALAAIDQPIPDIAVTRVLVPTFVADTAALFIETGGPAPKVEAVVEAINAARGLRYVHRAVVPALDAVDRDDVLVSRVRVGPNRIDLWLAYDRTRAGGAVPVALAVDAWRQAGSPIPSE